MENISTRKEDKSITEDNYIIARFMGMEREIEYSHGVNHYEWVPRFKHSNWCFFDAPPFHTSWDWLMPVVEKIESLGVKFKIDGVRVLVVSKQLQYYWNGGMVSEPKIICVYHGCVQFIKWYNSQAEYKR